MPWWTNFAPLGSMHTQGQVIEFIERAFGTATFSNQGLNASVVCPVCADKEDNLQKRKLVIRTDDFLTHCWVCNYRSTNLVNLLSRYKPHLLQEYREKFKIKAKEKYRRCIALDLSHLFDRPSEPEPLPPLHLPEGFTLLANRLESKNKVVKGAVEYLYGRGLTKEDFWLWKFGVTEHKAPKGEQDYRFRVIVPSFDVKGNLNYYSARTWWSKFKGNKYANPHIPRESVIFNELMIDWSQELTLVEGVFDLVKCNENATCLLGSTLDPSYLLFQRIIENSTPILLALDNDARPKTFNLAKLLLEYGISVRKLEIPKELNDVGQMTKQQFMAAREGAKLITTAEILRHKLESL